MACITWCVPRRSSATLAPSFVSNMRMSVPRSPAVAKRVPCMFSARHVTADSCAIISNGARSVFDKSTICQNTFERAKKKRLVCFQRKSIWGVPYRNMAIHSWWIRQNRFRAIRTQHAQAEWIQIRFKNMQLLRLRCECKHFDQSFQYDDNTIAPQSDRLHRCVEVQGECGRLTEVIPNDDFILWIQRATAATNQCQVVASK